MHRRQSEDQTSQKSLSGISRCLPFQGVNKVTVELQLLKMKWQILPNFAIFDCQQISNSYVGGVRQYTAEKNCVTSYKGHFLGCDWWLSPILFMFRVPSIVLLLERFRITFMAYTMANANLYNVNKFSFYSSFAIHYFCTEISCFMLCSTIRFILDSFCWLISQF